MKRLIVFALICLLPFLAAGENLLEGRFVILDDQVNLRSKPSLTGSVVSQLSKGMVLRGTCDLDKVDEVRGVKGRWITIKDIKAAGYVWEAYVGVVHDVVGMEKDQTAVLYSEIKNTKWDRFIGPVFPATKLHLWVSGRSIDLPLNPHAGDDNAQVFSLFMAPGGTPQFLVGSSTFADVGTTTTELLYQWNGTTGSLQYVTQRFSIVND